jgi:spore germination cell wall hydrolase CwlJ-like protein
MKLSVAIVIAGTIYNMKNLFLQTAKIIMTICILVVGLSWSSTHHVINKEVPINTNSIAKVVDVKQLTCLAKNIYFEAGGEPLLGQAAVARVVMNRIKHGFGSNPCNVIYQTTVVQKENELGESKKVKMCQFSWVCEGKTEPNTRSVRYQQARQVAYDVLAHDAYSEVIPTSTLFFHNTSIVPERAYNNVKRIGNHIFYSRVKRK